MKSASICAICLVLGLALSATAQVNPAHQNVAGRGYRPQTARAYQSTAKEHARVLNYYGKTYKSMPKETAQEHVAEVKRNVESAQKEFAKLDVVAKEDPAVAKSLHIIQEHHAKALELCKMADSESGKEGGKLNECCEGMHKEMEAAEVEHHNLLKLLKMESHAAPTKPVTAK